MIISVMLLRYYYANKLKNTVNSNMPAIHLSYIKVGIITNRLNVTLCTGIIYYMVIPKALNILVANVYRGLPFWIHV